MSILIAAMNAYREALVSPIRLLWVGLLPLIVALAIDLIAARPFIEDALRPILDPASASASVRLLVDPEYLGMRPLGPIFWFLGDLPWIMFVAIFLYRWTVLAQSEWRIRSVFGAVWPLGSWVAILVVAGAALTAGYAAGLIDWIEQAIQGTGEPWRISVSEGLRLMSRGHNSPAMVDVLFQGMFGENFDRARYLSETRLLSQIVMLPIGAVALARFGLVLPARAAGRPMTLLQSWRLTCDQHVGLSLKILAVAVIAIAAYLAMSSAIALIPDPLEPAKQLGMFGFGRSSEVARPGTLETFLLAATKILTVLTALGGVAALMVDTYGRLGRRLQQTSGNPTPESA